MILIQLPSPRRILLNFDRLKEFVLYVDWTIFQFSVLFLALNWHFNLDNHEDSKLTQNTLVELQQKINEINHQIDFIFQYMIEHDDYKLLHKEINRVLSSLDKKFSRCPVFSQNKQTNFLNAVFTFFLGIGEIEYALTICEAYPELVQHHIMTQDEIAKLGSYFFNQAREDNNNMILMQAALALFMKNIEDQDNQKLIRIILFVLKYPEMIRYELSDVAANDLQEGAEIILTQSELVPHLKTLLLERQDIDEDLKNDVKRLINPNLDFTPEKLLEVFKKSPVKEMLEAVYPDSKAKVITHKSLLFKAAINGFQIQGRNYKEPYTEALNKCLSGNKNDDCKIQQIDMGESPKISRNTQTMFKSSPDSNLVESLDEATTFSLT